MTHRLALLCLVLLTPACQRQTHDKPAPPASQKGQKRSETLLYVDGAPRASLSIGELPAAFAGGQMRLCDYLPAIGAPCPSLRAVHHYLRGGQVQVVRELENAQLKVEAGTAPRIDGVEVSAIAVYLKKDPPPLPVQGIPYLDEPVRGGTRVNVDGRLAARMKRNLLDGSLPEVGEGEPRYALADFLTQQRLGTARAVELVTSDDRVVAVPDAEVANISFAAEPEKHGQMSFHFGGRAVAAVAVNVYVASRPPARQLAPAKVSTPRQAGFTAGCSFPGGAPVADGLVLIAVALLMTVRARW